MTLTVTLEIIGGGISGTCADMVKIFGGHGCMNVTLPEAADIVVYDISGRPVFRGMLPAGENVIGSLEPGIYITLGSKVRVF